MRRPGISTVLVAFAPARPVLSYALEIPWKYGGNMRFTKTLAAIALVAVAAIGTALPAVAQTQSVLDTILEKKVLKVGTTGDYRPFSYLNPTTGKFEGIDIEMAGALGASLGVEVEFVQTKWRDILADFRGGKFDVVMGGISINLDRQKAGLFSNPVLVDGKAAISRCTDKDKFQGLANIDKPGVRAIVNPGGTNERFAQANFKQATVVPHPDNNTIFEQIIAGKADVMVTDAVETRLQQKLHPELCAINPDKPFTFAPQAYLLPRDFVFKEYVDQWLTLAKGSGAYDTIFKRWLE